MLPDSPCWQKVDRLPVGRGCELTCCWHAHWGALFMVVPPGHTVQSCCRCHATRTVHKDHAHEADSGPWVKGGR